MRIYLEPERRVEAMRNLGDLRLAIWGREKVWVGNGLSLRAIVILRMRMKESERKGRGLYK